MLHYKTHIGGTNGDVYALFIQNLLKHYHFQTGTRTLIMDNASIHKVEQVENVVNNHKIKQYIKYLPPYSPHLNPGPIEYMFKKLKQNIVHSIRASIEHLNTLVENAIASVTNLDCNGWYHFSVRYYFTCIAGERLE